jgi:hypothetical protein
MSNITKDTIEKTMEGRPKEHVRIILYLAEMFKGQEGIINENVKNKLIK